MSEVNCITLCQNIHIIVIPVKTGSWIPACAEMTDEAL